MKYQLIALPALAATVAAQDLNSILGVLQTALPSSLVAEAITNSAAVGSEIASQFAAGETPTWFSALPSDIQTYLVPTDAAAVSSLTAAASSLLSSAGISNTTSTPITTAPGVIGTGTLISPNGTVVSPNGTVIGTNGTAAGNSSSSLSNSISTSTSTRSGSGSATTGSSGSGTSGSSSESTTGSTGAAAMPTAFLGMGLAGAVGMIGVLAL